MFIFLMAENFKIIKLYKGDNFKQTFLLPFLCIWMQTITVDVPLGPLNMKFILYHEN